MQSHQQSAQLSGLVKTLVTRYETLTDENHKIEERNITAALLRN